MNPWSVNPAWQNYSSLFREAHSASIALTDLEKAHHLTSALYFGMAALEAFINQEMRRHLQGTKTEEEIFKELRFGKLIEKLQKWPEKISEKEFKLPVADLENLKLFNDIRGNLTHAKDSGHDIYDELLELSPDLIVDTIAKYIVRFHSTLGSTYPYWIFGWNYLNPQSDQYEIILLNDQQFAHSLANIGIKISAYDYNAVQKWKEHHLKSLDGYEALSAQLKARGQCEPKAARFPHQPKLCRLWWTPEHQNSCGRVTDEAMEVALAFDRKFDKPNERKGLIRDLFKKFIR